MKQLKDVSGMDVSAIYTEQIMFIYLNLLCNKVFKVQHFIKKNIISVHCNRTCIFYCILINQIGSITLVSVVGTGAL